MKLCTYAFADGARPAVVLGAEVCDVAAVCPKLPPSMPMWLAQWPQVRDMAADLLATAPRQPLERSRLLPPVPKPSHFLGIGLNYRDHAREQGKELPERPPVFCKSPQAVAAPDADVVRWPYAHTLDYEGELGLVIGRRVHQADMAEARAAIAGYVVVNDYTVRDYATPSLLVLAKSGRGHAPFGPWITTADDINDPHALTIRTWVNGELRQNSSTAALHHRCDALVAFLSQVLVLEPGDIITTGSPGGSGIGMTPPRYLQPGDVVRVEIDGLGHIENRITAG